MSLFSPRRYQAAFWPYRRDRDTLLVRALTRMECWIKGGLFGCRMCGNCLLKQTANICPMTCPKGLRNGLCGGATPEACEVDPSRPCTWVQIYEKSREAGHEDRLLEINAPLDGDRVGRETWLSLYGLWRSRGKGPRLRDALFHRRRFKEEWDALFFDARQPDWWQGDSRYHPPAYEDPVSHLEEELRAGGFVITGEIAPPLGASPDVIRKKADLIRGAVVAANFTDNASASARMSSLASSKICLDAGLEPIMQLQARDRSRVALESDAIGAAGLGIPNILCLSGDHHRFGPGPVAKPDQFDMDSIQLLWMLRRMRDEGRYLDGREIKSPPSFFLGAAASPFGALPEYEAIRAEKKINAGAQFIQTQPVFHHDRFLDWLEALDQRNLLGKVHVLAGLIPLKSARAAQFMANDVPGVVIPDDMVKRMTDAPDKDGQQEVGFGIAVELLEKLKKTPGISGTHIMAVHWESIVPRLVEETGLQHAERAPRP
ncbi:MAG: methylenetetrahydrofolate reductase C-terminal domain-containing protein [Gemmatimonadota bacterium]